jgi:GAF domain-containing protein
MILPLRLGEHVSGALVLGLRYGSFQRGRRGLAYSFSQQAALALDNARLYQSAEMRARQLQTLTYLGR